MSKIPITIRGAGLRELAEQYLVHLADIRPGLRYVTGKKRKIFSQLCSTALVLCNAICPAVLPRFITRR